MFSSPILRKFKRAVMKRAGWKSGRKPVQVPAGPTALHGGSPAPSTAGGHSRSLLIKAIQVRDNNFVVVIQPALAAVDIVVQLSDGAGRVFLSHTRDALSIRIVPDAAIEIAFPVAAECAPAGVASWNVDVSQGAHHAHNECALTNRAGKIGLAHARVEDFLRTRALIDVPVESLLPHGRDEQLSMAHLDDEEFVQYCYFWLLGRDADPGGLQHYLKFLREGSSRRDLIAGLFESDESANFRRLSSVAVSGQPSYPFSAAHDRMRLAMGAVSSERA